MTATPSISGPVSITVPSSVNAGTTFTLTYTVANATSATLQNCFATNTGVDTTGWVGVKTGSPTPTNVSLVAPSSGTVYYSLTCGGVESALVALTVH